jgi:AcrR family transcriptional regulator
MRVGPEAIASRVPRRGGARSAAPSHTPGVPYIRRVDHEQPALPEGIAEDGTRHHILLAALKLFAQRGFHGTSIREIADAAGLRSASLYAHFPSKEHILGRLMVLGHEALLATLRAAVLDAGPTPRAQFLACVRAHVKAHCDYAMLSVVINNELHALSPEHAEPAVILRREAELLALEIVQRGIHEGEWNPPNLVATMKAIGSIGIRTANWFQPSAEHSAEDLAAYYAKLALHMLDMDRHSSSNPNRECTSQKGEES